MDLLLPRQRIVKIHEVGAHRLLAHDGLHIEVDLTAHVALGDRARIEQILREEMDKIDGQEVQFPVVMPASLWDESGRYDSIGDELLRFTDRNNAKMVLGMTHEEAAVHLVREYAQSYTKYPFMIYQIQTKFRDEARPRAGLIRVREFTMKDAYSFHTSQEDLEQYYDKCHKAYELSLIHI